MNKPTREQVDAALRLMRHWWPLPPDPLTDTPQRQFAEAIDRMLGTGMLGAIRTLMAHALSDPGPPRPDDMAELARLVAVELRKRGIWAFAFPGIAVVNVPRVKPLQHEHAVEHDFYAESMHSPAFDNLTPCEIANLIQCEEAARAAEWAGDT